MQMPRIFQKNDACNQSNHHFFPKPITDQLLISMFHKDQLLIIILQRPITFPNDLLLVIIIVWLMHLLF